MVGRIRATRWQQRITKNLQLEVTGILSEKPGAPLSNMRIVVINTHTNDVLVVEPEERQDLIAALQNIHTIEPLFKDVSEISGIPYTPMSSITP